MTCKLSVNVNAVAYLRNRRAVPWPDLIHLARIALLAGAKGITVHPRPDERHIRRNDVPQLATLLRQEFPSCEYNIEGYPSEDFLRLCEVNKPDQVTLVPDLPGQGTSDHGWDLLLNERLLREVTARLKAGAMRVALFVDADPALPPIAKSLGADRIEIYTGPYGAAVAPTHAAVEFDKVVATGRAADLCDTAINAGHDLNLVNLPALVKALPNLREVSIGHGVFADAWEFGLAETVRKYRSAIGDVDN